MQPTRMTRDQLLIMYEMCADGEAGCRRRADAARKRGDRERALRELHAGRQYAAMKSRLHEALRCGGAGAPNMHKVLRAIDENPFRHP